MEFFHRMYYNLRPYYVNGKGYSPDFRFASSKICPFFFLKQPWSRRSNPLPETQYWLTFWYSGWLRLHTVDEFTCSTSSSVPYSIVCSHFVYKLKYYFFTFFWSLITSTMCNWLMLSPSLLRMLISVQILAPCIKICSPHFIFGLSRHEIKL